MSRESGYYWANIKLVRLRGESFDEAASMFKKPRVCWYEKRNNSLTFCGDEYDHYCDEDVIFYGKISPPDGEIQLTDEQAVSIEAASLRLPSMVRTRDLPTRKSSPPYLAVSSTDSKFMARLIDWLNKQDVTANSTIVRVHDMDPYEEVDLLRAQIEGMTIRLYDAESKLGGPLGTP